jgi:YidC/Oxa1 family membrane protein insertase
MTDDKKRLLTFIILTLSFMSFWQWWYVTPQLEARQKWDLAQKDKLEAKEGLTLQDVLSGKAGADALVTNGAVSIAANDLVDAKRVRIESPVLSGSFSLRGARFDDLTMLEFKQTLEEDSGSEVLLSKLGGDKSYFAELGWIAGSNVSVPNSTTVWQADGEVLSPETPVTLSWKNDIGLVFKRKVSLDDHYLFTFDDTIENTTGQPVQLTPYGRINRARADETLLYISHEGPMAVVNEVLEEMTYDDIADEGKIKLDSGTGWIGLGDKYWLTAIIPPLDKQINVKSSFYTSKQEKRYQIEYSSPAIEVGANESASVTRHLFAGAKKVAVLDKYGEDLNVPLFDRAVDYGWLYFLTKPLLAFLLVLNGMIGNFGLAILVLTVIVKLALFPLASKSYRSFARMRLYMPEMTQIKERHKDDRMKMNEEMMSFYKKHRINPASGCLPMLLQLPVFFALYKVLYISIEMRHAPFYGWIKDLSVSDPTSIFNAFGLIPIETAVWLPVIGVWPVLYAVSMWIQQMLNPPPSDPTQAIVMKWLPLIFLFIFAGFPAGLVLYWVWNNTLSIAQQYYITKKINADPLLGKAPLK